jgi:ABC-type branched-subunit amino acid transport system ATPase component/ABC-type branched-subunit amino acid transport system permease subunit
MFGASKTNHFKPILLFALGYLAVAFLVNDRYYQLILTLVPIWAMLGIAWNVFSGYSGLVSFGHAAFFGVGAYTVVLGMLHFQLSPWIGIPLGTFAGVIAGVLIGLPTFRLRGIYFALAMLAFPLTILYVFEWLGYQEVAIAMMRGNPVGYMQFESQYTYIVVSTIFLSVALYIASRIHTSRFGLSLTAIKQNEAAAEGAGIDSAKWKLRAIMVSGAIAGAAGGYYAVVLIVITPPTVFGMITSAQAMIVTLFGGVATVWGPVIGAAVLIPLSEILHAELGRNIHGINEVVFGIAIILMIIYAPEGLFPRIRDLFFRKSGGPGSKGAEHTVKAFPGSDNSLVRPEPKQDIVLRVSNVARSFGGLKAVSEVSFEVRKGEVLGIIGPNGAGKTTLFNLLNGFVKADAGSVVFNGQELIGLKPNQVCRAGVGRTFQVVRPFPRLTVLQNVIVGAYVSQPHDDALAEKQARDALGRVGMSHYESVMAGGLNSLELRLMELARVLAGQPKILLLDETLAGLGGEEVEMMLSVISRLAQEGQTIVIIEHTMHAMVRIADRFVVLDHGAVLAVGKPLEITKDPQVIEAYLGKKWLEHAKH